MGRTLGLAVGGLLLVMGAVFTLQGLGYLEGSTMTGETQWAIIGPILAVVGLVIGVIALRRPPTPLE